MKSFKIVSAVLVLALGLGACASTPKITRTEADSQIDLSGNWNDTDSQLVSQEMITDAFANSWITDFTTSKNAKPKLIVGTVLNKSIEHINTETFVKDLERTLTNSGKVRFVASKEQRDEVRDERIDQSKNASMNSAKSAGQESGADYMIKGQINTIYDEAGNTALKYYQVELELIDLANNEKVWIGQKKIKKVVKRSGTKF
ncbi:MAG: penicillin-binding protein activator LpoB [Elusimicrobia bacterium RIFOXYA2_FULL_39_19]|nr:MAG: penicillin-binding protein activator LpoB [Elusimicrobia bacterium RIFOXYA2_FULL_39_19]